MGRAGDGHRIRSGYHLTSNPMLVDESVAGTSASGSAASDDNVASASSSAISTPVHEQEARLAHLITHWNPTLEIQAAAAAAAASQDEYEYAYLREARPSSHRHASSQSGLSVSTMQQQQQHQQRRKTPKSCRRCNVQETPKWRHGPDGTRSLCNVCGLIYEKRKSRGAPTW
jgi:CCR4-NOT transcriptional regulation complex NOT5 subunit